MAASLAALSNAALAQNAPAVPAAPPPPPGAPVAVPAAPAAAATADLEKQVTMQRADLDEQDARIAELEKALKEMKKAQAQKPEAKKDDVTAKPAAPATAVESGFKVTGYVQAQVEGHQDSEDQLQQGGGLLNQNRFLLRRTRLKIARDWQYGGMLVELDANTVKGPAIGLQHAEVSLAYRNTDQTPLLQFT